MDKKLIEETKLLNNYNLNTVIDNFQLIVQNFQVETFGDKNGYENHRHTCYELHYIDKGTGSVDIEGTLYHLEPGDLYVTAPLTPHEQFIDDVGMIEYALRFDVKKLNAHGINPTIENETNQLIELLQLSSNKIYTGLHDVGQLFEKAFMEAHDKSPGYFIKVKQAITEIIIHTARLSYVADTEKTYDLPSRSNETDQLLIITEFINQNIATPISNKDLAKLVHISERQLHRLTKNEADMSPHQYVTQLRISYAKELMDKRIYTLKRISEMTGFSSEFHLSSTFKKYEGLSPKEYLSQTEDPFIVIRNT